MKKFVITISIIILNNGIAFTCATFAYSKTDATKATDSRQHSDKRYRLFRTYV